MWNYFLGGYYYDSVSSFFPEDGWSDRCCCCRCFINATKDLNVLLWPGDAYKNADKCKKNVATQMTTYYHIDISGIEFDTVEYKEATEEAAAHVEITVKAKTQH